MKLVVLSLLGVATLPLVAPQCLTENDASDSTPKLASLYQGQPQFALSMLQTLESLDPQTNLFFSPLSVYHTLLLAYFISANHTEKALQQALYLPPETNKVRVLEAYMSEHLVSETRTQQVPDYQLVNADHMFIAQNLTLRKCMEDLILGKHFADRLDFLGDINKATDYINEWVTSQTRGQITNLIPPGRLSPDSKLVLANAAYFKGLWKSKFLPAKVKKEIFHISSTERALITMMRQKGTFNHLVSEALGAHVLQLPYKGDSISMFVFLPPYAAPRGITNILKRLTPQILQEILSQQNMIPREVEVGLPKFSIEQSLELVPVLANMGVGDLFNASADLSLLTGSPDVQLNDAIHKAKISVDEEGTTAAAATAVFTFRSSRPLDVALFICNHPFVYLLYDSQTQAILFTGVYNSPPASEEENRPV